MAVPRSPTHGERHDGWPSIDRRAPRADAARCSVCRLVPATKASRGGRTGSAGLPLSPAGRGSHGRGSHATGDRPHRREPALGCAGGLARESATDRVPRQAGGRGPPPGGSAAARPPERHADRLYSHSHADAHRARPAGRDAGHTAWTQRSGAADAPPCAASLGHPSRNRADTSAITSAEPRGRSAAAPDPRKDAAVPAPCCGHRAAGRNSGDREHLASRLGLTWRPAGCSRDAFTSWSWAGHVAAGRRWSAGAGAA